MPKDNELMPMDVCRRAAECLKTMAHPVRLRIVEILMRGEYPVCEIAEMCELSPNQTCEHLRLLQGHGFLDSERRGRAVYYKIVNPRLSSLVHCIRSTCPDCEESQ